MTVAQTAANIAERLSGFSDAPLFEAKLLTAKAMGKKRLGPLDAAEVFPGKYCAELERLVERRLSREPLQYILGEWSFMGLDFKVRPCALIPRQDTETLCETALGLIRERGYETALDICTGTGCIAVALKKLGGLSMVSASDISAECAELARENARMNGVDIDISVRDLFEGHGSFDIITANPPYISAADMETLQEEVRREPELALFGGGDGLDIYRRIARELPGRLDPGGALLLEVGMGQARDVAAMFAGRHTDIVKDICGTERVVTVFEE